MAFYLPLPAWGRSGWGLVALLAGLFSQPAVYGQTAGTAVSVAPAECPLALTVRVTDAETGQPLPGATVRVLETSAAQATDAAGHCRLRACPGHYQVVGSLIGYRTQTVEARLRPVQPASLRLALRATAQESSAVQVQGQSEATTLQQSAQAVTVLNVRPYYGQALGLTELVNQVPSVRIRQDGGLAPPGDTLFQPNLLSKGYSVNSQLNTQRQKPVVDAYLRAVAAREALAGRFSLFNPAVNTQNLLSQLAGTDLPSYLRLFNALPAFHRQIVGFYFPRLFRNQPLTAADYAARPIFQAPIPTGTGVGFGLLELLAATAVLFGIGYWNLPRRLRG
ncbi:DUF3526 domain-containing protein [Hymenobacter lapidiphilus]|uniref:DUF3526 domain-containing protein n=1 Tax=Hymenobacter sp. CCM 8763 TaxID=2303334 RepID=UPI000E34D7DB|nr:DUF3526 domain-containing protein [Hymenobacter sp. CCM 8763]RFP64320.1 DUF3526 domain-containing protein [Hymenobacter sp. CCM 8763]